jgi:hypothetical protein
MPNVVASRAPGRPARANATAARAACRPTLRRACGSVRYLLDERACAAVDVVAEEPADRQPHRDRPPRDGKIRQVPPITGMHPCRHPPASVAARPPRPWMRGDHHHVVDPINAIDHHRRQLRKQNPATALQSHRPRAPRRPASRKVRQNHLPRSTTHLGDSLQRLHTVNAAAPALELHERWLRVLGPDHPDTLTAALMGLDRAGPRPGRGHRAAIPAPARD